MGKRPRKRIAAFGAAGVFVALLWLAVAGGEPSYEGRSLSDWVVAMRDGPDKEAARKVVHRMAIEHWPVLVEWLRNEDRLTLKGEYHSIRPWITDWMIRHRIIKPRPITAYFDPKESYHALGLLALEEAGPDAKAAIPTLIELLALPRTKEDGISPLAGSAFLILPRMAPESTQPLIQALSSTNEQVRQLSAGALGRIGTNACAAIPVMETWLQDKRLITRLQAAAVLGEIGEDPKVFVPVVIASLQGGNVEFLDYKLNLLIRFKGEARPAVPLLLAILTNTPDSKDATNIIVRNETIAALKEIDPKAAAEAGLN